MKNKIILLLWLITQVFQNNGLVQLKNSLATSDSPLLMKILQSVDAATSDEHLLDVTLKLLKSLCICMRETLKAKEEHFNFGDNTLEPVDSSETDSKVLDLYRKIYNNTCFNLRQELTDHTNKQVVDEETAFLSHTNCGKNVKSQTYNVPESTDKSQTLRNSLKSKLQLILRKALIETKGYHVYKMKRYNLFGKSKPETISALKHSIIVILTLHPDAKEISLRKPTVVGEALNKTLHTKSPIDIDIIDTSFDQKNKEREIPPKPENFSDCNLQSLYKFLSESEKYNLTKVFKFFRKRDTIKIYIEVKKGKNHTDYINICCDNGTIIPRCSEEFINDVNSQAKINSDPNKKQNTTESSILYENYRNTITKIKKLVKLYEHKLNGTSKINTNVTARYRDQNREGQILNSAIETTTKQSKIQSDQIYEKENDIHKLVSNSDDPLKLGEVTGAILFLNDFVSKQATNKVSKIHGADKTSQTIKSKYDKPWKSIVSRKDALLYPESTKYIPINTIFNKFSTQLDEKRLENKPINESIQLLPPHINSNSVKTEKYFKENTLSTTFDYITQEDGGKHNNKISNEKIGDTLSMSRLTHRATTEEIHQKLTLKADEENFVNNTIDSATPDTDHEVITYFTVDMQDLKDPKETKSSVASSTEKTKVSLLLVTDKINVTDNITLITDNSTRTVIEMNMTTTSYADFPTTLDGDFKKRMEISKNKTNNQETSPKVIKLLKSNNKRSPLNLIHNITTKYIPQNYSKENIAEATSHVENEPTHNFDKFAVSKEDLTNSISSDLKVYKNSVMSVERSKTAILNETNLSNQAYNDINKSKYNKILEIVKFSHVTHPTFYETFTTNTEELTDEILKTTEISTFQEIDYLSLDNKSVEDYDKGMKTTNTISSIVMLSPNVTINTINVPTLSTINTKETKNTNNKYGDHASDTAKKVDVKPKYYKENVITEISNLTTIFYDSTENKNRVEAYNNISSDILSNNHKVEPYKSYKNYESNSYNQDTLVSHFVTTKDPTDLAKDTVPFIPTYVTNNKIIRSTYANIYEDFSTTQPLVIPELNKKSSENAIATVQNKNPSTNSSKKVIIAKTSSKSPSIQNERLIDIQSNDADDNIIIPEYTSSVTESVTSMTQNIFQSQVIYENNSLVESKTGYILTKVNSPEDKKLYKDSILNMHSGTTRRTYPIPNYISTQNTFHDIEYSKRPSPDFKDNKNNITTEANLIYKEHRIANDRERIKFDTNTQQSAKTIINEDIKNSERLAGKTNETELMDITTTTTVGVSIDLQNNENIGINNETYLEEKHNLKRNLSNDIQKIISLRNEILFTHEKEHTPFSRKALPSTSNKTKSDIFNISRYTIEIKEDASNLSITDFTMPQTSFINIKIDLTTNTKDTEFAVQNKKQNLKPKLIDTMQNEPLSKATIAFNEVFENGTNKHISEDTILQENGSGADTDSQRNTEYSPNLVSDGTKFTTYINITPKSLGQNHRVNLSEEVNTNFAATFEVSTIGQINRKIISRNKTLFQFQKATNDKKEKSLLANPKLANIIDKGLEITPIHIIGTGEHLASIINQEHNNVTEKIALASLNENVITKMKYTERELEKNIATKKDTSNTSKKGKNVFIKPTLEDIFYEESTPDVFISDNTLQEHTTSLPKRNVTLNFNYKVQDVPNNFSKHLDVNSIVNTHNLILPQSEPLENPTLQINNTTDILIKHKITNVTAKELYAMTIPELHTHEQGIQIPNDKKKLKSASYETLTYTPNNATIEFKKRVNNIFTTLETKQHRKNQAEHPMTIPSSTNAIGSTLESLTHATLKTNNVNVFTKAPVSNIANKEHINIVTVKDNTDALILPLTDATMDRKHVMKKEVIHYFGTFITSTTDMAKSSHTKALAVTGLNKSSTVESKNSLNTDYEMRGNVYDETLPLIAINEQTLSLKELTAKDITVPNIPVYNNKINITAEPVLEPIQNIQHSFIEQTRELAVPAVTLVNPMRVLTHATLKTDSSIQNITNEQSISFDDPMQNINNNNGITQTTQTTKLNNINNVIPLKTILFDNNNSSTYSLREIFPQSELEETKKVFIADFIGKEYDSSTVQNTAKIALSSNHEIAKTKKLIMLDFTPPYDISRTSVNTVHPDNYRTVPESLAYKSAIETIYENKSPKSDRTGETKITNNVSNITHKGNLKRSKVSYLNTKLNNSIAFQLSIHVGVEASKDGIKFSVLGKKEIPDYINETQILRSTSLKTNTTTYPVASPHTNPVQDSKNKAILKAQLNLMNETKLTNVTLLGKELKDNVMANITLTRKSNVFDDNNMDFIKINSIPDKLKWNSQPKINTKMPKDKNLIHLEQEQMLDSSNKKAVQLYQRNTSKIESTAPSNNNFTKVKHLSIIPGALTEKLGIDSLRLFYKEHVKELKKSLNDSINKNMSATSALQKVLETKSSSFYDNNDHKGHYYDNSRLNYTTWMNNASEKYKNIKHLKNESISDMFNAKNSSLNVLSRVNKTNNTSNSSRLNDKKLAVVLKSLLKRNELNHTTVINNASENYENTEVLKHGRVNEIFHSKNGSLNGSSRVNKTNVTGKMSRLNVKNHTAGINNTLESYKNTDILKTGLINNIFHTKNGSQVLSRVNKKNKTSISRPNDKKLAVVLKQLLKGNKLNKNQPIKLNKSVKREYNPILRLYKNKTKVNITSGTIVETITPSSFVTNKESRKYNVTQALIIQMEKPKTVHEMFKIPHSDILNNARRQFDEITDTGHYLTKPVESTEFTPEPQPKTTYTTSNIILNKNMTSDNVTPVKRFWGMILDEIDIYSSEKPGTSPENGQTAAYINTITMENDTETDESQRKQIPNNIQITGRENLNSTTMSIVDIKETITPDPILRSVNKSINSIDRVSQMPSSNLLSGVTDIYFNKQMTITERNTDVAKIINNLPFLTININVPHLTVATSITMASNITNYMDKNVTDVIHTEEVYNGDNKEQLLNNSFNRVKLDSVSVRNYNEKLASIDYFNLSTERSVETNTMTLSKDTKQVTTYLSDISLKQNKISSLTDIIETVTDVQDTEDKNVKVKVENSLISNVTESNPFFRRFGSPDSKNISKSTNLEMNTTEITNELQNILGSVDEIIDELNDVFTHDTNEYNNTTPPNLNINLTINTNREEINNNMAAIEANASYSPALTNAENVRTPKQEHKTNEKTIRDSPSNKTYFEITKQNELPNENKEFEFITPPSTFKSSTRTLILSGKTLSNMQKSNVELDTTNKSVFTTDKDETFIKFPVISNKTTSPTEIRVSNENILRIMQIGTTRIPSTYHYDLNKQYNTVDDFDTSFDTQTLNKTIIPNRNLNKMTTSHSLPKPQVYTDNEVHENENTIESAKILTKNTSITYNKENTNIDLSPKKQSPLGVSKLPIMMSEDIVRKTEKGNTTNSKNQFDYELIIDDLNRIEDIKPSTQQSFYVSTASFQNITPHMLIRNDTTIKLNTEDYNHKYGMQKEFNKVPSVFSVTSKILTIENSSITGNLSENEELTVENTYLINTTSRQVIDDPNKSLPIALKPEIIAKYDDSKKKQQINALGIGNLTENEAFIVDLVKANISTNKTHPQFFDVVNTSQPTSLSISTTKRVPVIEDFNYTLNEKTIKAKKIFFLYKPRTIPILLNVENLSRSLENCTINNITNTTKPIRIQDHFTNIPDNEAFKEQNLEQQNLVNELDKENLSDNQVIDVMDNIITDLNSASTHAKISEETTSPSSQMLNVLSASLPVTHSLSNTTLIQVKDNFIKVSNKEAFKGKQFDTEKLEKAQNKASTLNEENQSENQEIDVMDTIINDLNIASTPKNISEEITSSNTQILNVSSAPLLVTQSLSTNTLIQIEDNFITTPDNAAFKAHNIERQFNKPNALDKDNRSKNEVIDVMDNIITNLNRSSTLVNISEKITSSNSQVFNVLSASLPVTQSLTTTTPIPLDIPVMTLTGNSKKQHNKANLSENQVIDTIINDISIASTPIDVSKEITSSNTQMYLHVSTYQPITLLTTMRIGVEDNYVPNREIFLEKNIDDQKEFSNEILSNNKTVTNTTSANLANASMPINESENRISSAQQVSNFLSTSLPVAQISNTTIFDNDYTETDDKKSYKGKSYNKNEYKEKLTEKQVIMTKEPLERNFLNSRATEKYNAINISGIEVTTVSDKYFKEQQNNLNRKQIALNVKNESKNKIVIINDKYTNFYPVLSNSITPLTSDVSRESFPQDSNIATPVEIINDSTKIVAELNDSKPKQNKVNMSINAFKAIHVKYGINTTTNNQASEGTPINKSEGITSSIPQMSYIGTKDSNIATNILKDDFLINTLNKETHKNGIFKVQGDSISADKETYNDKLTKDKDLNKEPSKVLISQNILTADENNTLNLEHLYQFAAVTIQPISTTAINKSEEIIETLSSQVLNVLSTPLPVVHNLSDTMHMPADNDDFNDLDKEVFKERNIMNQYSETTNFPHRVEENITCTDKSTIHDSLKLNDLRNSESIDFNIASTETSNFLKYLTKDKDLNMKNESRNFSTGNSECTYHQEIKSANTVSVTNLFQDSSEKAKKIIDSDIIDTLKEKLPLITTNIEFVNGTEKSHPAHNMHITMTLSLKETTEKSHPNEIVIQKSTTPSILFTNVKNLLPSEKIKSDFDTTSNSSARQKSTNKTNAMITKIYILDPNSRQLVFNRIENKYVTKKPTDPAIANNPVEKLSLKNTKMNNINSSRDNVVAGNIVTKNVNQHINASLEFTTWKGNTSSTEITTPLNKLFETKVNITKTITHGMKQISIKEPYNTVKNITILKIKMNTTKIINDVSANENIQANKTVRRGVKSKIYYIRDSIGNTGQNVSNKNNSFIINVDDGVKNISYIHTPILTQVKVTKMKPVNNTNVYMKVDSVQTLLPVLHDEISIGNIFKNNSKENDQTGYPVKNTNFRRGKLMGDKVVEIYSSRLNRQYFMHTPVTAVTKNIKYNTYQPTTKEDLELLKYDSQPIFNTLVYKKIDDKPHYQTPVNNYCTILRNLRNTFKSVTDFMASLKAANCTEDDQLNYAQHQGNRHLTLEINRNLPLPIKINKKSHLKTSINTPPILEVNKDLPQPEINKYSPPIMKSDRSSPLIMEIYRNSSVIYHNDRNSTPKIQDHKNSPLIMEIYSNSPAMGQDHRNSPLKIQDHRNSPGMNHDNRNSSYLGMSRGSPENDQGHRTSLLMIQDHINSPFIMKMNSNSPAMDQDHRNLPPTIQNYINSPFTMEMDRNSPLTMEMNRNSPGTDQVYRNIPSMIKGHLNSPSSMGTNGGSPAVNQGYRNSPPMIQDHMNSLSIMVMNRNSPAMDQDHRISLPMIQDHKSSPLIMEINRNSPAMDEDHTLLPLLLQGHRNSPPVIEIYRGSPMIKEINRNSPQILQINKNLLPTVTVTPATKNTKDSPQIIKINRNLPPIININRNTHPMFKLKKKPPSMRVNGRNSHSTIGVSKNLHSNIKANKKSHQMIKGHRNTHPNLEINRNLHSKVFTNNFKRNGFTKGSLLDPFDKTNSYAVKKPVAVNNEFKRVKLANKRIPVMTMNTQDFFSQRRFMTPRSAVKNNVNTPPIYHRPITSVPRYSILRPKFDNIDKAAQRFRQNMRAKPSYIQDQKGFREAPVPYHHTDNRRNKKDNLEQKFQKVPVTSRMARLNNVLDRPMYVQPTEQPNYLKDMMDPIRNYLFNSDFKKVTRRPTMFNVALRKPEGSDDSEDNNKSAFYRRSAHKERSTTVAPRTPRHRRTIFFLSPTIAPNQYF